MLTKRCWACVGSKKVMSGGMIYKDCEVCEGVGHLYIADKVDDAFKDTETKSAEKVKGVKRGKANL